MENADKLVA